MMRFEDITTTGTDLEVKKNIDNIVRLIAAAARKISPKDEHDIIPEIVRRTSLYAALHLRMIIDLYDFPIECTAWIARNLFEMNLILEYSIHYPEKAKEFVLQKGSDEKEILEGILTLNSNDILVSIVPLRERIGHLESILKKYGKSNIKHFTVAEMARKVGMENDYNAFFKLYSKYVHPTAWLIFAEDEEKASMVHKNTFLLQAQYYSSRILKICEDLEKT